MSVRQGCQRRLDEAKLKIKNGNSELATLTRKRDEAIAAGNAADAIRFKNQLKSVQEQLEDYTITKLALEAKVRVYEKNEPEAAKIREQIAATWSQLVDIAAGMAAEVQHARKTLNESLDKSGSLEAEVKSLAAKHMDLVGEVIRVPDWTLPARAYHDALSHLEADRFLDAPLPPWTYTNEADRISVLAKQRVKEAAAQAARVKVAIEQAPLCGVCKKPMTLRRDVSQDGEVLPVGSGTWQYQHCFRMATKQIPETVLSK